MSRELKDSGVKWIGKIPTSWSVQKVKTAFYRSKEEAHIDDPIILSLARSGVKIRDISTNEGQLAESYYNYNPVVPGDLLLNPMDLYSGANCSISKVSGVISPAYINLRTRGDYCPAYYDYYFKTQYWAMALFSHGKGVSFDNRWTLSPNDLFNYYIPVPEYDEQKKIADFLDRTCSEIDAVIDKTKATIEEYKALKQSVITDAVTKGIRSDRTMKDTGIEWIGSIPIEWGVSRFKYVASVKSNLVAPDAYLDYPQISPENIEKGSGKLLPCRTVAEVGVISGNHLFYKGQIIYSKIRPKLNKVVIAPFDGLCSADMYPIETRLNKRFFLYSLLSDVLLQQVSLITEDRVKMPKINQEELGNTWFAIPTNDEQQEIADYLDKKCAEMDTLIAKKTALLEEMENYKKSVIYEYVTGKKQV